MKRLAIVAFLFASLIPGSGGSVAEIASDTASALLSPRPDVAWCSSHGIVDCDHYTLFNTLSEAQARLGFTLGVSK